MSDDILEMAGGTDAVNLDPVSPAVESVVTEPPPAVAEAEVGQDEPPKVAPMGVTVGRRKVEVEDAGQKRLVEMPEADQTACDEAIRDASEVAQSSGE